MLVTALIVISIALGFLGWALHPRSNGFQSIPQDLTILVSGSQFTVSETLTQTTGGGAVLTVSGPEGLGFQPLQDSDSWEEFGGPTGAGPVLMGTGPVAAFNGQPLPDHNWTFIVMHPGGAQPCNTAQRYASGKVQLPLGSSPQAALIVPPLQAAATIGNDRPRPALCLRWTHDAPIGVGGSYLAARFPPLRSAAGPFSQIPQNGDVGAESVVRVLTITDGITSNFNVQSDPHPVPLGSSSWTWSTPSNPQVIQVAAVNVNDAQHENNRTFYSGVLFGIVGGALIALITELVVPLSRRKAEEVVE